MSPTKVGVRHFTPRFAEYAVRDVVTNEKNKTQMGLIFIQMWSRIQEEEEFCMVEESTSKLCDHGLVLPEFLPL